MATAQAQTTAPAVKMTAAESPTVSEDTGKKPADVKPAQPKKAEPKAAAKGPSGKAARSEGEQAIVALVNDEPVTGYEVQQRQRLAGLGANIQGRAQETFKQLIKAPSTTERLKVILNETIKANEGKTKDQIIAIFEERKKQFALSLQKQALESARASVLPGLKKVALDELIEERLKLQEAKRLNVVASDEDVDRIINGMAERNKMNQEQFGQYLAGMGASIDAMKQRIKVTLSWKDVIRRRFGHLVAITERDVDRLVAAAPAGEDDVELQIQRLKLVMPAKMDQKQVAQRLQEAEVLRAKFGGCATTANLATSIAGANFEDLGSRKPTTIPEPTRSLLLTASDGEMLPPSVGDGSIELWAVCGRKTIKADEQKRTAAQDELRQKEFEVLAARHLKDLRQDAHIEYR